MKIFVSGATGVVGWRAVRDLMAAGHDVTAAVRSGEKAALIRSFGARPVKAGLFDREALGEAVAGSEAVINLATSIPPAGQSLWRAAWRENDRVRSEGSSNLVDAALAAGADRYIQESVTFLYADGGDAWLDEASPVDPTPLTASALEAEANVERFRRAGGTGVVLRFGSFYGPDSEHIRLLLRLARLGIDPLPGKAGDYMSSISTDDAAAAVVAALEAPSGTFNIVDDIPLTRRQFDRALAEAVGAGKVRRPPAVGKAMEHFARSQRVSNARFRAATGWAPRYPSLTDGLPDLVRGSLRRRPAAAAGSERF